MRYNSLSDNLIARFGCKVYRLAIEGGYTCPNRDGTCGVGGCIFCAEGSGNFACTAGDTEHQLNSAIKLVKDKCSSGKYIAYFQTYTATYMPAQQLYERLMVAAKRDDIVAISVATRPDCLDDEVLHVLSKVAAIKPLSVELGLQTASDKTAQLINRCYPTDCYIKACERLRGLGIEVVAHLILGLPGEKIDDMLETVNLVNATADGVKFQLMHVLRGTKLYDMYQTGEYTPLELDEYIDILCECVLHLAPRVVIYRLTGDGDKRLLAAPMWSGDKKRVLNSVNAEFARRDIIQGLKFNETEMAGKSSEKD